MLPTKIVVKIGCAVLLVAILRPERTGRLAIEAVRSIASAAGDTDACLIFFIHVVWCYLNLSSATV